MFSYFMTWLVPFPFGISNCQGKLMSEESIKVPIYYSRAQILSLQLAHDRVLIWVNSLEAIKLFKTSLTIFHGRLFDNRSK